MLKMFDINFNSRQYIFIQNKKEIKNFSGNISICTVNSKSDFKEFFKMPWIIYKNDKNWVPPFWFEYRDFFTKKNPFWSHAEAKLFLIQRNHEIVGRIAGIIDHLYCKLYKRSIGFFGFFECINDFKCAKILFESAQKWLESKQIKYMQGPINGRVDVGSGFLTQGFNSRPSLLSSYSPEYYTSFVKKFNMEKIRDLLLYYIDLTKPIPKKLEKKAQQCLSSGIKIRRFNRFRTNKEIKWWIELLMETFKEHWGFVPISKEEVKTRFGIKQIRWFVDSDLFLIAESEETPIAFIWSTPDYNLVFQRMNGKLGIYQLMQFLWQKHKINLGKLPLIGIKKGFRDQNIGSCLNYLTLLEMKKRGYLGAEVGWIDERNKKAHATISITGAKPYKKLSIYEKKITSK